MVSHRTPGSRKGDEDPSSIQRPDTHGRVGDEGGYKGLCANCAKRHNCLLPKSEGGVWHCEEYVEEN